MDTLETFQASLVCLLPALTLVLGGCLLLSASVVLKAGQQRNVKGERNGVAAFSLLLLSAATALSIFRTSPADLGTGLFRFDDLALASERLALLGGFLLLLISWSTAPKYFLGEYHGCLLIILGAIPIVGAANDLVSLFVGLELVSIPTYILLGISKTDNASAEATLKYFLLSAFSSTFFLLGVSYLFGVSGSTNLQVIQETFTADAGKLTVLAVLLVLCGLSFRITAFPFHFYAPDVFAGTSLTVAALMSYLPKVVGFVAMIRVLNTPWAAENLAYLVPVLLAGSAATMLVGNLMATAQKNLRRLLAYSSVAHTGYMLLAISALIRADVSADVIIIYLAAYAAMTLGLFACLGEIEAAGGQTQQVDDIAGMFYRCPIASLGMTICLISMIGLPLTAGFWAKFFVFTGITATGLTDPVSLGIGVLMAVNAAIAAGYYWRVLSKLYEKAAAATPATPAPQFQPTLFVAYSICVALTLFWFFVPPVM